MEPSIFNWIKAEEGKFETQDIQVGDNWWWNFRKHVQLIFHLSHGIFFSGENNWTRAFKMVMRPLLRLSFWTEDLEVKDVFFYIEGKDDRVTSFLIKKYHDEVFVRENNLDVLFDEITENDITYGGVMIQKGVDRPESLPLNSIAFCDQTDLMGGAFAFKYNFSPSALRKMKKFGWGNENNGATISIEDLIILATYDKDSNGTLGSQKNDVPSKTIEVYIVRGAMPEHYLNDNNNMEDYYDQLQIVAYYVDKDKNKQGVWLYRKKDDDSIKFFSSEPIYGRALGYSDGEALLPHQIWSNFVSIHDMNFLESASKVPLYTDDPTYTQKNRIQDMENLEITTIEDGKRIYQVPTATSANHQLFRDKGTELYESAQLNVAAFDSIMGKEESSGTTFKGQERLVAQGRGWHDRRRGQRAKFIEEIYRWDIIPRMVKKITNGKKFLASLSMEEMRWVADSLATKAVNERIKEMILNDKLVTKEEQDLMIQTFKQEFFKSGNKKLLEIIKGELEGAEIRMGINIAGKQKNLVNQSDKILSIIQFAATNPQGWMMIKQDPSLSQAFNDLLEYSGISPVSFSMLMETPINPQTQESPVSQKQELALASQENG